MGRLPGHLGPHGVDVYPKKQLPPEVTRLAGRRRGLLTAAQLDAHDINRTLRRRMVRDGELHRVARGIFAVKPPDAAGLALAGVLIARRDDPDRHAAVGGVHALDLPDLNPALRTTGPITIWVAGPQVPVREGPWRFRRDGLGRLQRAEPRWRIDHHDAALDVLAELPEDRALGLTLDLLREGRVNGHWLAMLLHGRLRHRHRGLLHGLISDAEDGVQSTLEHRYRHDVERAHGLPQPVRQARVGPNVVDAWYRQQQLAIELDGWRYHKDRVQTDARRDNARAAQGIVTLRFSWSDVVDQPCITARAVATTLRERGWSGKYRPCGRCPA